MEGQDSIFRISSSAWLILTITLSMHISLCNGTRKFFRPFPLYLCSKARLLNGLDPFWLRLEFFSIPPLSHHLTISFLPLAHKEEKSISKVNHFTHPTDPWYMLVYWQQWHPYIWALHMEHTEPCTFGQLDTGISDQEKKVTKIL